MKPDEHLESLFARRPELMACRGDLVRAFELLTGCFRQGGKLLLCGNGGSAADCEHWSAELLKGFHSRRPLEPHWRETLGEHLAAGLQQGLPAIPLTSLTSLATAFANDVDPALGFAQAVWALGRPGDALVGISTSGGARNVLLALRAARARGLATIGLTGTPGGELPALADVCIRVPAVRVELVQELHLPVYHTLCLMLEAEFFPDQA